VLAGPCVCNGSSCGSNGILAGSLAAPSCVRKGAFYNRVAAGGQVKATESLGQQPGREYGATDWKGLVMWLWVSLWADHISPRCDVTRAAKVTQFGVDRSRFTSQVTGQGQVP